MSNTTLICPENELAFCGAKRGILINELSFMIVFLVIRSQRRTKSAVLGSELRATSIRSGGAKQNINIRN